MKSFNLNFKWSAANKLDKGWLRSQMSSNKVKYLSDQVVKWGHMTNELHYIFIFTIPIATKLYTVITSKIKVLTTV